MNNTNFDQEELNKFEAGASRWWDPEGEFKPLHDLNPLRVDYIRRNVTVSGRRVLDVGCGGGILSESLAALGGEVTGIDLAPGPLATARLHLAESGLSVDYRQTGAEQLAAETPGVYHIVTCLEMLEHVPDPAAVVTACARLAAPGGTVFFSTLNRNPKSWLFAIAGAEYVLQLLPKGTHDYKKFIRPSELGEWCAKAGLTVGGLTGIHYNPLTRRYRLGPGVDVNYLVRAEKRHDA